MQLNYSMSKDARRPGVGPRERLERLMKRYAAWSDYEKGVAALA